MAVRLKEENKREIMEKKRELKEERVWIEDDLMWEKGRSRWKFREVVIAEEKKGARV